MSDFIIRALPAVEAEHDRARGGDRAASPSIMGVSISRPATVLRPHFGFLPVVSANARANDTRRIGVAASTRLAGRTRSRPEQRGERAPTRLMSRVVHGEVCRGMLRGTGALDRHAPPIRLLGTTALAARRLLACLSRTRSALSFVVARRDSGATMLVYALIALAASARRCGIAPLRRCERDCGRSRAARVWPFAVVRRRDTIVLDVRLVGTSSRHRRNDRVRVVDRTVRFAVVSVVFGVAVHRRRTSRRRFDWNASAECPPVC